MLYQYSRLWVSSSLTAKIGRKFTLRHIVTDCDVRHAQNRHLLTSLAFQMSMLERFEKVNLSKNLHFGPT